MAATDIFKDYDDQSVFDDIQQRALDPRARNFVVEFGPEQAKIAFNLNHEHFQQLIHHENPKRDPERPVRWINIWGPNVQTEIVRVIGTRYGFSRRLQAILESSPVHHKAIEPAATAEGGHGRASVQHPDVHKAEHKADPEVANGEAHRHIPRHLETPEEANHYTIASLMLNFQSLDLGARFLCIGANFVYHKKRLWSWLVLCDDCTVLSLHEENTDIEHIKQSREHTLNVLRQLSEKGLVNPGTMSMISVREILKRDVPKDEHGSDGASNLYYYLFDNWHGTYQLIINMQRRLEKISREILKGVDAKHVKNPDKQFIPQLYKIGKELRRNQHLYEGYDNIIERILRYKAGANSHPGKRVVVALTASERFERLSDRIKLLVLSSIKEAIGEQQALLNTYFNITAQNDSAATAKLSRNAALLSKLGVVFLPVSLMTSYFSVQIQDLQGVYTSQTYWICFAVVMAISFILLFFLSRFLVAVTESLELRAKQISLFFARVWGKIRRGGKDGPPTSLEIELEKE